MTPQVPLSLGGPILSSRRAGHRSPWISSQISSQALTHHSQGVL